MTNSYTYVNRDPVIEFLVKDKRGSWARFLAYVDSGAMLTVLTRDDANRLGLTLDKGKRIELHGISGTIPAYIHQRQVKVAGKMMRLLIAFSTSNETPRLLGRQGIFEQFEVCFNDKTRKINFRASSTSP